MSAPVLGGGFSGALEIERRPHGATRPDGRCYVCCTVPWVASLVCLGMGVGFKILPK